MKKISETNAGLVNKLIGSLGRIERFERQLTCAKYHMYELRIKDLEQKLTANALGFRKLALSCITEQKNLGLTQVSLFGFLPEDDVYTIVSSALDLYSAILQERMHVDCIGDNVTH